nr:immunoglobulin light chain junction region [Macaca mulatta]
CHHSYGPPFTF